MNEKINQLINENKKIQFIKDKYSFYNCQHLDDIYEIDQLYCDISYDYNSEYYNDRNETYDPSYDEDVFDGLYDLEYVKDNLPPINNFYGGYLVLNGGNDNIYILQLYFKWQNNLNVFIDGYNSRFEGCSKVELIRIDDDTILLEFINIMTFKDYIDMSLNELFEKMTMII